MGRRKPHNCIVCGKHIIRKNKVAKYCKECYEKKRREDQAKYRKTHSTIKRRIKIEKLGEIRHLKW